MENITGLTSDDDHKKMFIKIEQADNQNQDTEYIDEEKYNCGKDLPSDRYEVETFIEYCDPHVRSNLSEEYADYEDIDQFPSKNCKSAKHLTANGYHQMSIKREEEEDDEFCNSNVVLSEKEYDYEIEDKVVIENCKLQTDNLLKKVKPFNCNACDYRGKTAVALASHKKVHTKERPFKCIECAYTTKRKSDLSRHLRHHKKDAEFYCNKCPYKAENKINLVQHQVVHAKVKSFKCDKCSFETYRAISLINHQQNHTQVKTFECDKCLYKSMNRKHFIKHQLSHKVRAPIQRLYKVVEEMEQFNCTKCDYSGDFSKHQFVHVDPMETFKCDTCSFTTNYKTCLFLHMAGHGKKFLK